MRKGGRYIVKKKGDDPVLLEEGTKNHPEGNKPRPAIEKKPQQSQSVQKEVEKDGAEK